MVKKAILLLAATSCFGFAKAQFCSTDEVHQQLKKQHPEIEQYEAQLKADLDMQLMKMDLSKFKTTADEIGIYDTTTLYVPLVFHIVHDYGSEYVSDNQIYEAVNYLNKIYNRQFPDINQIIPTYRGNIPGTNVPYIGKANIEFRLATKDPTGNPTHGITRNHSYLGTNAGNQSKIDQWPPQAYLNIWLIRTWEPGSTAGLLAFSIPPSSANVIPWIDGVISLSSSAILSPTGSQRGTLGHELAHSLSISHPWSATNQAGQVCGDDDVDDTPPTKGHTTCNTAALYDTACVFNKFSIGKPNLSSLYAADTLDNTGISFQTFSRINLDSVTFYPSDSGKIYQIVLRRNGTIMSTFNGVTTNNKRDSVIGKQSIKTANVADSMSGVGIRFKIWDSLRIKSVTIYPTAAGNNFQIALKRNNIFVSSYSGVTSGTGPQVVPLDFFIPFVDTSKEYTLDFAINPGAKRDLGSTVGFTTAGPDSISNAMKITSDTFSDGRYNYFYSWNVTTYNFAQKVNLNFTVPRDINTGSFSLEFSNNPGAKRDTGAASNSSVPGALTFNTQTSGSMYNYFYDWKIRTNYYKTYSPATAAILFGDSTKTFIDYPDTTNTQNIMDYSFCPVEMFTYLQTVRMRGLLRSNVANRNNLIKSTNLAATGVLDPWPDLAPIADFSTNLSYVCPNQPVSFTNRSWNDTVSSVQWSFVNGSDSSSSSSTTSLIKSFTKPGWVSTTITANSNAGSNTVTKSNVYVADNDNPINTVGYYQEFNTPGDIERYPLFNYFNNNSKWEAVNYAGFYDNTSIRYKNYDSRVYPATFSGTPKGDFDDFFTPAFDLSAIQGSDNIYLNFWSSGASRTNVLSNLGDTLQISYSTCPGVASSWTTLAYVSKAELYNKGTGLGANKEWVPGGFWDWSPKSFALPKNNSKLYFRFRYFSKGVDPNTSVGTGNHFYIDRLHISPWTTEVSSLEAKENGIAVAPNPTSGSTSVVIKDSKNRIAEINVTDVTGKLVFSTTAQLNGGMTKVEIPANYIAVKGMYLIQVTTGAIKQTEKLVVY